MKKTLLKLVLVLFLGIYAVNAVMPYQVSVFAAEQNTDDSQQKPKTPEGDDKKDNSGHSGHH